MRKKKAFKNATEEIQYIGAMLTATTQVDTKRIDAAINRLREINHQEPKPLRPPPRILVCKVTIAGGKWTARCEGQTASSTVSDAEALKAVGLKVFGHDNTQALEIESEDNITTWLLREKPDQKPKTKKAE